jgi:hypothetical protein
VVRSIPDAVSPRLIAQACENPYGQLAWRYPAIFEVVAALAARGYAILGGDVMYANEDAPLDYYHGEMYCGNWYRDWKKPEESWADYVAASVSVTKRYIEAYVQRNGDAYWFGPSFTHEQGYQMLSRHKA